MPVVGIREQTGTKVVLFRTVLPVKRTVHTVVTPNYKGTSLTGLSFRN